MEEETPKASHDAKLHGATHDSEANPLWFLDGLVEDDAIVEDNEALVLKAMGLQDTDNMYSQLDTFMTKKNVTLNPKPFPNSRILRAMSIEERFKLVFNFVCALCIHTKALNDF